MTTKSIIDNFKECVKTKFAKFDGRADRAEFWQFWLAAFTVNIALSVLSIMTGGTVVAYVMSVLYCIFNLAILVPTLAVSARRMHDIGKGGGWVCLAFIPIIGTIWFLVLAAQEGEPAPNRFG